MRRILAAVLVLVALSACTVKVESEPTGASTSTASPDKELSDSDKYLLYVAEEDADLALATDQNLLTAGRAICEGFDSGLTTLDVVNAIIGTGLNESQIATLVSGATQYLCPEHLSQVRSDVSV